MRWLLVVAGALAITACGSSDSETDAPAVEASTAPTAVTPLVGTYGAAGADGQPWTTQLAADGTYRNTVGGEVTESGRWNQTGDQLCFTPESSPTATATGAATPAAICQTLVMVNPDGNLVLRDGNGQQTTAPRLPS